MLTTAKSIDISSPSDFQHCLSVQPEVHQSSSIAYLADGRQSSVRPSLSSTPTEDTPDQFLAAYMGANLSQTNNSSSLHLSPVAGSSSPSLRLKIMGKYLKERSHCIF